jgi:RNA polymerase sigma-70 factor (ECF subfamily)
LDERANDGEAMKRALPFFLHQSDKGTKNLLGLSNLMKGKKPTHADEDGELVSLCKKGDLNAFEELVRRHQKRMFNMAYRLLGDYDEAANVVQDAFLSAYRGIGDFEERARFSTWLHTILINHSRNRLKQLRAQRLHEPFSLDDPLLSDSGQIKIEPASDEPSALEGLERRDIQEKVQQCISKLDSEYREVIILRDMQGFSYEEISDVLRIPEGTVKSRLFRARESLKDALKKAMGDL